MSMSENQSIRTFLYLIIGLVFLIGCDFGLDAPFEDANGIYLDLLSSTPVSGSILLVQGDKAYVSHYDSLRVFDISDKLNPKRGGAAELDKEIKDAKVRGSYIYAVADSGFFYDAYKFIVINVGAGFTCDIVGELELEYSGDGVEIDGNYAYVRAGEDFNYLLIIDISSPTNPVLVKKMYFASSLYDCVVENKIGYLLHSYEYSRLILLSVYDFSNPICPLKSFGISRRWYHGEALAKQDEYLYIRGEECGGEWELTVVKIVGSKELKFIREIKFPEEIIDFDFDEYGVASDNSTLYLLNLEDPSYPCVAEKVLGGGTSLITSGDYMYYLSGGYLTILKAQRIR